MISGNFILNLVAKHKKGAVTNDVSQPLYSEYVQKLASEVISLTKRKIGRAIFVWLFLLLDAGQLFHNLFIQIQIDYDKVPHKIHFLLIIRDDCLLQ